MDLSTAPSETEACVLVGVAPSRRDLSEAEASLEELDRLAETAGAQSVARSLQVRESPDPATYVGSGKAMEIAQLAAALGANTVICDDELRPAQREKLEQITGAKVVDRTSLILDIFAQHARSAAGKIQVELAQNRYRLAHLTGSGSDLSRLGGGIGTRGPGEQKLEVDRRRLRTRVSHLERELRKIEKARSTQRKRRTSSRIPQVTLVGYTNAGKSSLMNRLTDHGVEVADKLFATLDPQTGRLKLPGGRAVVLTDTVGFVKKLPHELIQAFRSTLDEVREADLLLHVVDAASPDVEIQVQAVREVLGEIEAGGVKTLIVANKSDIAPASALKRLSQRDDAVAVSAVTGEGIDKLVEAIAGSLSETSTTAHLQVPYSHAGLVGDLHREGTVLEEDHGPDGIEVIVQLPRNTLSRYADFVASEVNATEPRARN